MDPIANMFAALKNAWRIRKKTVELPYSNAKVAILKIFKDKGLIDDFRVEPARQDSSSEVSVTGIKKFVIFPHYDEDGAPVEAIKKISKSGRRVYIGYKDLRPVRQGYGFRIISTSRGVMIDTEARKKKLGGEVICEVT